MTDQRQLESSAATSDSSHTTRTRQGIVELAANGHTQNDADPIGRNRVAGSPPRSTTGPATHNPTSEKDRPMTRYELMRTELDQARADRDQWEDRATRLSKDLTAAHAAIERLSATCDEAASTDALVDQVLAAHSRADAAEAQVQDLRTSLAKSDDSSRRIMNVAVWLVAERDHHLHEARAEVKRLQFER